MKKAVGQNYLEIWNNASFQTIAWLKLFRNRSYCTVKAISNVLNVSENSRGLQQFDIVSLPLFLFAFFWVVTIFNTINPPICPICISNGIYDCVGKGKVWSKSSQLDSSAFFFLPTQYITLIIIITIIIVIIIIIRTGWSLVLYWKATSSESAIIVPNLSSSSQMSEHFSNEKKTNGQWSCCHGGNGKRERPTLDIDTFPIPP